MAEGTAESDNSMDPLIYGGNLFDVLSQDGMSRFFASDDIILSNEFEFVILAPGQVSPEQTDALAALTLKGRANNEKASKAVTILFDMAMLRALIAGMRGKYVQIPVEFR